MKLLLAWFLGLAAMAGGGLVAAPPKAVPAYVPDLKAWRLEVTPALGGWSGDRTVALRVKLVDPKDPAPPKDEPEAEPDEEDAGEGLEGESLTAERLRQARLEREAEEARNAWRSRTLRVWFNGAALTWRARVGTTLSMELSAQNGENRLEILEPDSGLRAVRTWWVSTARTRLRVVSLTLDGEWTSGSLQVQEPDGALAERGRRTPSGGRLTWSGEYSHDAPPPGTYTLRWTGGWRGAKPSHLRVEAVLDGGTDQERRWTWERLILPGAGPTTLGTFDVEP